MRIATRRVLTLLVAHLEGAADLGGLGETYGFEHTAEATHFTLQTAAAQHDAGLHPDDGGVLVVAPPDLVDDAAKRLPQTGNDRLALPCRQGCWIQAHPDLRSFGRQLDFCGHEDRFELLHG